MVVISRCEEELGAYGDTKKHQYGVRRLHAVKSVGLTLEVCIKLVSRASPSYSKRERVGGVGEAGKTSIKLTCTLCCVLAANWSFMCCSVLIVVCEYVHFSLPFPFLQRCMLSTTGTVVLSWP